MLSTEYDWVFIQICIIVYIIITIYIYNAKRNEKIQNEKMKNEKMKNEKMKNEKMKNEKMKNEKIRNEKIFNDRLFNEKIKKINDTLNYIIKSNNDMMFNTRIDDKL